MPYWLILIGILLITGCTAPPPSITARLDAVEAINRGSDSGFARVLEPRPFVFPQDHGPHPEYAIEWWYYTGNLDAGEHRFGYQLTFFRSALTPEPPERASPWGTSAIYMAHLALSDVANGRFYAFERFSRDAVGLAGASGEPFRVFLEDWSAEGSGPEGMTMHLRAAEEEVALDLTLVSRKAPALQGDQGLSQKGLTPGNASFYYSLTRMETNGTVRIGDAQYAVTGLSWMDHEWGTSALEDGAVGWDWFSLQLDDGREIMYAQVRTADAISYRLGSLVEADGTMRILDQAPVTLDVLDTWRSPRSGAVYPSGWQLTIPELALELTIQPALRDQELPVTIIYWEGAVDVQGSQGGQPLSGRGYVELTGYAGDDCRSVDCRW
ncbi:lipocalin-like domain-containing protein [Candidatus Chloroploca sp. Khr17]|uniref:lipocalin-like domain-containing protein n=1 Tax=Candidatus Chloroploca sp. Khr17 TaxID=2496869 RepID=UPI00101C4DA1|nr:lipocalin-like domain-containing protein [Candidatus Chloroploca sp. Khr17]